MSKIWCLFEQENSYVETLIKCYAIKQRAYQDRDFRNKNWQGYYFVRITKFDDNLKWIRSEEELKKMSSSDDFIESESE